MELKSKIGKKLVGKHLDTSLDSSLQTLQIASQGTESICNCDHELLWQSLKTETVANRRGARSLGETNAVVDLFFLMEKCRFHIFHTRKCDVDTGKNIDWMIKSDFFPHHLLKEGLITSRPGSTSVSIQPEKGKLFQTFKMEQIY